MSIYFVIEIKQNVCIYHFRGVSYILSNLYAECLTKIDLHVQYTVVNEIERK